jgi:hypothetical protein
MSIQRVFAVAAGYVVIVTMVFGSVVQAHHSIVGYDRERTVTIEGVVTEFGWRNPHPFLIWEARHDDGSAVKWTGELTGPIPMVSRWGV